jgi:hypothetical protein
MVPRRTGKTDAQNCLRGRPAGEARRAQGGHGISATADEIDADYESSAFRSISVCLAQIIDEPAERDDEPLRQR